MWAIKIGAEAFSVRNECIQDEEKKTREEDARKEGGDKSDDTVSSVCEKERDSYGDGKAFVGEDKSKSTFLIFGRSYERLSNYVQVSITYTPVHLGFKFVVHNSNLNYSSRELFELVRLFRG